MRLGDVANRGIKYFYVCDGRDEEWIDNARNIKQLMRKIRIRRNSRAALFHTSNDNAYLALEDLIIEYKATLIIHDCMYHGIPGLTVLLRIEGNPKHKTRSYRTS